MKKIATILMSAIVLVACKDSTKFSLNGKFENQGTKKKVFLYHVINNNWNLVDSTNLSENGEFKFTHPSPETNFYKVSVGMNEYPFIAKNGDVVKLRANLSDKTHTYTLKGSEDSNALMEFNKLKETQSAKIDSLSIEYERRVAENPGKQKEITDELEPVYMKEKASLDSKILKYAMDNPKSFVGFYAINSINPMDNEENFIKYAEIVDPSLKKNKMVADFVERVANFKILHTGQPAPDFTINGLDGKPVSLKDFRGKYLLIDFWASWCAPCREENPNVVKAYQKFKNKNFTILGISLDKDKAAWQNAIKQDGLTWKHASELADFNGPTVRLYQVEGIPSSFLIDPQGKIIARNLRGEELEAFLSKTL